MNEPGTMDRVAAILAEAIERCQAEGATAEALVEALHFEADALDPDVADDVDVEDPAAPTVLDLKRLMTDLAEACEAHGLNGITVCAFASNRPLVMSTGVTDLWRERAAMLADRLTALLLELMKGNGDGQ